MTDKTVKAFIKEYENDHIAQDAGILERFARPGIFGLVKNIGKEAVATFKSEPQLFIEVGTIALGAGVAIAATAPRGRIL